MTTERGNQWIGKHRQLRGAAKACIAVAAVALASGTAISIGGEDPPPNCICSITLPSGALVVSTARCSENEYCTCLVFYDVDGDVEGIRARCLPMPLV